MKEETTRKSSALRLVTILVLGLTIGVVAMTPLAAQTAISAGGVVESTSGVSSFRTAPSR